MSSSAYSGIEIEGANSSLSGRLLSNLAQDYRTHRFVMGQSALI